MPLLLSLPLTLLLIARASAQVPSDAPACAQTCGRVKVSEGYCSSSAIFSVAYANCLRENCNAADATRGLQYTTSICGANSGANATSTASSPLPAATGNVTAGNSSEYGSALNAALQGAGLTSLATLLASPAGQSLVGDLSQGNHSVFAPSNDAFSALGLNLNSTNSSSDVQALLKYHILPGIVNSSEFPQNGHAIVRSSLAGQPYVNLPGNDSQAIVFANQQNGSIAIIEPTRNVTVGNPTQVNNLQVSVVSGVLTIPGSIATTVAGVPELSNLVAAANGTSAQLLGELDQTPGLTIFAPINSALNGAANTNFQAVLLNHIVNGTVLYSTSLANITNATTAGGALVTFGNNAGEATATVGTKTVKIVQADILTKNGVIHLVDGIFDPSNSTATFPLPNSNNASETVGITPVGSAGSSASQNAAKNSAASASTIVPSFGIIMMMISGIYVLC